MSQEHLWTALGRARTDVAFSGRALLHPRDALRESGYTLTDEEFETFKQSITPPPAPNAPGGPVPAMFAVGFPTAEDVEFHRKKMQERLSAQVDRVNELGTYTVSILKDTLDNARSAYHTITKMNSIMFFTGIGLFVASAIYGSISKDTKFSLLIAGLGAVNFVALFVLGPIERTQTALSNLVQVEIAFMNYFEQITLWDAYAVIPSGNPPVLNPVNIREASDQLQRRSSETIALLQRYVEEKWSGTNAVLGQITQPPGK